MSRDALVVGINSYQHLRSLSAPANDAEAISQLLSQDNNFLIRRLPEYLEPFEDNTPRIAATQEVTKAALKEAILRLFLPPSGHRLPQTALFYFSGHGLRDAQGISEGFLATGEANPQEDRWGISLKWLREILKQSEVPQQVVWLDCCYAAELFNYEEANPKGRDRCFIAAAREFEESWQDSNSDYSVMTRVLVQGLDPQYQPDGLVDNYRLVALISQTLKEGKQRPVFFNVGEPILLVQSRQRKTPDTTIRLQPEVCPYRGLAAFDATEEDVRFFYGRTALTDELLETIWQQNFLAVLGPSGSGKSSVVRAGLIHVVQQGEKRDTKHWQVLPVIKPGEHPVVSLAEAFIPPGLTARQKERTRQGYIQSLQEEGATALVELVSDYAPDPVLLMIDQFEEIFTLCQDDRERQQFLGCLMGTLDSSPSPSEANSPLLKIVITMRADFFGKCLEQDYSGLAERIKTNTVPITPLNRDELRDAIVQPAAQVGLQLEPELVQQMIMDVQGSLGSLPLLQYALTELWEQWHQGWQQNGTTTGNILTLKAYTEIGGVSGALEKQANKVYNSLSEIEQRVARRIFLELTQLGEGIEDTRRRVLKRELLNNQHPEGLLDQVIHKLSNTRLIVTDEQTDGTLSEVLLDVAHEVLIRHWTELRRWVDEDRDTLRTERKLKAAAQEWQDKGQQVAYLWLGTRLAEAEEIYQQSLQLWRLDYLTQNFVQASRAEQARVEQEKTQQVQSLNKALIVSRLQEQVARAQYLTLKQPRKGLELTVEATRENLTSLPDQPLSSVQGSLQTAMATAHVSNKFMSSEVSTTSVAFSPDGRMLVSGNAASTLQLWDLKGNPVSKPFEGHKAGITSVAFSPDGQLIVSGSHDKTLRVWNLQGDIVQLFVGHEASVTSVTFSHDGKRILSGSWDNTLRLWDLQGHPIGDPFQGHKAWVNSIVFSPDGKIIVSGSYDKTIRVWDLEGNPIGQPFIGHWANVTSVAFSPNGKIIVSGSYDKTIRVWDLEGNPIGQPFIGHRANVTSVAFSPDGQTIISGSDDGTIRRWGISCVSYKDSELRNLLSGSDNGTTQLSRTIFHNGEIDQLWKKISGSSLEPKEWWDVQGYMLNQPLRGHRNSVTSVAVSPDSQTIASSSDDQSVRFWNLASNSIESPFEAHNGIVNCVAFSPDGQLIVSGSDDQTLRLWDCQGNPLGPPFQAHNGPVTSVAFSPDDQLIVSGSDDQTLRLWDCQGNPLSLPFQAHNGPVTSVAFSPDGQLIVSGSYDRTFRLWDFQGNPIGLPFQAHEEEITSVAFSPDSQLIVSGSRDQTVRLWRGSWQAWLKVCCDRLAYHLISEDPEIDIAQTACAVCIQHAWNGADLAQLLKRQGNDLARQGKIDLALSKFQQAAASDPSLNLDPESEVGKWSHTSS